MATASESNIEQLFRILLHQIGIKLTPRNCHSLKFLNNISSDMSTAEVPALDILQYLQSHGKIGPLHPEHLEQDLLRIERQDLATLVKQFKKSDDYKQAKKSDNNNAKSKGQVGAEEKCASILLSFTLMHTAQSIGQTKYFLETFMDQMDDQKPHELTVVMSDIKKDFDQLGKSLKKAITITTRRETTENQPIYSTVYKKPKARENENTTIPTNSSHETLQTQPQAGNLNQRPAKDDPVGTQTRPNQEDAANAEGYEETSFDFTYITHPKPVANNKPSNFPGYSVLFNQPRAIPPRQQRAVYMPILPPRGAKGGLKSTTLPPHPYANLPPQAKKRTKGCLRRRSSSLTVSSEEIVHIRDLRLRAEEKTVDADHNHMATPSGSHTTAAEVMHRNPYENYYMSARESSQEEEESEEEEEDEEEEEAEEHGYTNLSKLTLSHFS